MSEFRALIEEARGEGGSWIQVPPSVVAKLGGKGRIPVEATFDGIPYRGSVVPMGQGVMVIGMLKAIKLALGKDVGDEVTVVLTRDESSREVEMPADLAMALASAGLNQVFAGLSFTRKREIPEGVAGAKKPDTRRRRIAQAVAELAERNRNSVD